MLDKKDAINNIIKLIDYNYLFLDNQKMIWEDIVIKLHNIAEDTLSDGEFIRKIDILLCELGDPHLRLFNIVSPDSIFDITVEWQGERLLFCDFIAGFCYTIDHINHISMQNIITEYTSTFSHMPISVIRNEILSDIKKGQGIFNKQKLYIQYRKNDMLRQKCFQRISSQDIKKKMCDFNFEFKPIFKIDIDEDTVLIKIVTFRDKALNEMFLKLIDEILDKKNIILDIRDNGGGFIDVAKKIVSYIISHDIYYDYNIKTKDNLLLHQLVYSNQLELLKNKNIFLFVNENTMSAAEFIFAKAIQLEGRNNKIIGRTTSGLSGQAVVYTIPETTLMLQITIKKYIDLSNENEINKGIEPDISIEPDNMYHIEEDPYLKWYQEYKNMSDVYI